MSTSTSTSTTASDEPTPALRFEPDPAEVAAAAEQVRAAQQKITEAQAAAQAADEVATKIEAEIATYDNLIASLEADRFESKHDKKRFHAAHSKLQEAKGERERLGMIIDDARRGREEAKQAEERARLQLQLAEYNSHDPLFKPAVLKLFRASAHFFKALSDLNTLAGQQENRLSAIVRAGGRGMPRGGQHTAQLVLQTLNRVRDTMTNLEESLGHNNKPLINVWTEELRAAFEAKPPAAGVRYSAARQAIDLITGDYASTVSRLEQEHAAHP